MSPQFHFEIETASHKTTSISIFKANMHATAESYPLLDHEVLISTTILKNLIVAMSSFLVGSS